MKEVNIVGDASNNHGQIVASDERNNFLTRAHRLPSSSCQEVSATSDEEGDEDMILSAPVVRKYRRQTILTFNPHDIVPEELNGSKNILSPTRKMSYFGRGAEFESQKPATEGDNLSSADPCLDNHYEFQMSSQKLAEQDKRSEANRYISHPASDSYSRANLASNRSSPNKIRLQSIGSPQIPPRRLYRNLSIGNLATLDGYNECANDEVDTPQWGQNHMITKHYKFSWAEPHSAARSTSQQNTTKKATNTDTDNSNKNMNNLVPVARAEIASAFDVRTTPLSAGKKPCHGYLKKGSGCIEPSLSRATTRDSIECPPKRLQSSIEEVDLLENPIPDNNRLLPRNDKAIVGILAGISVFLAVFETVKHLFN